MTEASRPMWRTAVAALVPSAKVLYRLSRDERLPGRIRAIAVGALAYAALPIDLVPDRIPIIGKLDDLGLAAYGLVRLVEAAGAEIVHEHWDGDDDGLEAFLGAVDTIGSLIPKRVRRTAAVLDR